MKRILSLLNEKMKLLIKKFPMSLIALMIMTIFLAIFIDNDILDDDIVANVFLFFFWLYLGFFYIEICFNKKKNGYIIAFFLAIILLILRINNSYIVNEIGKRLALTYTFILLPLIIYQLFKKSKKKLEEYAITIFSNSLKTSIIYGILSAGFIIICNIFTILIFDDYDFDFVVRIEILLLGLFFVPNIMMDLTGEFGKDIHPFIKIIVRYTLNTLIIIAFIIIYLYFIKILLTFSLPSNQVFGIVSTLFMFYLPIWILNNYYQDNSLWSRINHILPYAFIPFVFIQSYSLLIRIFEYGFTPTRYLGIFIILFEIIYLIFVFKKEAYEKLLWVIAIMIIVAFILPFVNMYRLSNMSQYLIMKNLITKEDLSKEELQRLAGSYNYLDDSFGGDDYLKRFTKEELERVDRIRNIEPSNYSYFSHNFDINNIDVSKYQELYIVHHSIDDTLDLLNEKVRLSYSNGELDITNVVKYFMELYGKDKMNYDDYHTFEYGNKKLIIEYISMSWKENDLSNLLIDGYLLQ